MGDDQRCPWVPQLDAPCRRAGGWLVYASLHPCSSATSGTSHAVRQPVAQADSAAGIDELCTHPVQVASYCILASTARSSSSEWR
eukprot:2737790-Prymnesium_polylepis.2